MSNGIGPDSLITFFEDRPDSEIGRSLIRRLDEDLLERYPLQFIHGLRPRDVRDPALIFIVAYQDGKPVGCGAVRPLDEECAEIKRMFVLPEHRGQGIARTILAELEKRASARGYRLLRLETGTRQPEAIALYTATGYREIPPYGEYEGNAFSVCFEKVAQPRTGPDAGMTEFRGSLASSTTGAAPRIRWYPATEPALSGMALVIFPGGGYGFLADYEGEGYARHFAARGICCFVVAYRLGSQGFRHPAMLEDALAALATIRSRAAALGVNPNLIGVMGSSAGGHLAAHAMVAYEPYGSSAALRPDFGVLCYPVISLRDELGHRGTRDMLLGPDPRDELLTECSCDLHVSSRTPPCFLWHTREDELVPFRNSTRFADALHAKGVPFELHIFDRGLHGLGRDLSHPWAATCYHWLQEIAGR